MSSPSVSIIAQPVAPQIQIAQTATGIRVTVAGAGAATWPTVEIGDMPILAQWVVVSNAHNTPAPPISSTLDCRPWAGQHTPNSRPIPEGDGQAHPDLALPQAITIPHEPISLLREGRSHG